MRDATTADLPKTAMRQRNPEPGVQRHAAYQVHPPHTVPHRSCRRGQPANVVGGFLGVWVYIRNPRERGARPGVLVTVNAAPLGCSTIAVPGLSFRVRNGVRASHLGHGRRKSSILLPTARVGDGPGWRSGNRRMDAMFRCSVSCDRAPCRPGMRPSRKTRSRLPLVR